MAKAESEHPVTASWAPNPRHTRTAHLLDRITCGRPPAPSHHFYSRGCLEHLIPLSGQELWGQQPLHTARPTRDRRGSDAPVGPCSGEQQHRQQTRASVSRLAQNLSSAYRGFTTSPMWVRRILQRHSVRTLNERFAWS